MSEPIGDLPNAAHAVQAAIIHMRTQQLVDRCHNFLLCLRRLGMGDDDPNVALTKAKMRVYYTLLQGDTTKCRATIESLKALANEQLDHVMDGRGAVSVMRPMGDHYDGKEGHTDENARQMGNTLKNSIEVMGQLCAAMEQFR